ncbi:hypothetical protein TNCV_1111211 [Trichonephila clavipes]|nr:hypothetical protein TNCV_1111211 [Trichonephila clavipes]
MAQQSIRAGYCAHISIRDLGSCAERISRSGGQPDAKPPVLSFLSKLSTHIYRSTEGEERQRWILPSPDLNHGPVVRKRDALPFSHWANKINY